MLVQIPWRRSGERLPARVTFGVDAGAVAGQDLLSCIELTVLRTSGSPTMSRIRIFRGRGRGSYQASELVSLFILSLMGGMFVCCVWYALDFLLTKVLHVTN